MIHGRAFGTSVLGSFLKKAPKIRNRRNVKCPREDLQKKNGWGGRIRTHSPHVNKFVTAEEWIPLWCLEIFYKFLVICVPILYALCSSQRKHFHTCLMLLDMHGEILRNLKCGVLILVKACNKRRSGDLKSLFYFTN